MRSVLTLFGLFLLTAQVVYAASKPVPASAPAIHSHFPESSIKVLMDKIRKETGPSTSPILEIFRKKAKQGDAFSRTLIKEKTTKAQQFLPLLVQAAPLLREYDEKALSEEIKKNTWDYHYALLLMAKNHPKIIQGWTEEQNKEETLKNPDIQVFFALLRTIIDNSFSRYFHNKDSDEDLQMHLKDVFWILRIHDNALKELITKHVNLLLWRKFVMENLNNTPRDKIKNMREINFSGKNLIKYPPEFFELKDITTLDLSRNGLESLPNWVRDLKGLQVLFLNNNGLETLPSWIGSFPNLRILGLGDNRLQSLPPEMVNLKNLEELILDDNNLTTLPSWIGSFSKLKSLNAAKNGLEAAPPEIGQLQNLEGLSFRNNKLNSLPPEIGNLIHLGVFDLWENNLATLPESFSKLLLLPGAEIELDYNPLATIGPVGTLGLWEIEKILTKNQQHATLRLPAPKEAPPISTDQVLKTINESPLHLNLGTIRQLNPLEVPESPLNPQQFMDAFEKMVSTLNFVNPNAPGYVSASILLPFREEDIKRFSNEQLIQYSVLNQTRAFLKVLVGIPLAQGEQRPDWQMYPEQAVPLKNALAYIFTTLTTLPNRDQAASLFSLFITGLFYCPTGQKEGIDTVILALSGKEGVSSSLDQKILARVAFLKNDVWKKAILPGDHPQNVHVLGAYADKTRNILNISSSLKGFQDKIGLQPHEEAFKKGVPEVVYFYLKAFTPPFLIRDLKDRISTWQDEQDADTLSNLNRDIQLLEKKLAPLALPPTDSIKSRIEEIDALLKNEDALKKQATVHEKDIETLVEDLNMRKKWLVSQEAAQLKNSSPPTKPLVLKEKLDLHRKLRPLKQQANDLKAKIRSIKNFTRPYSILEVIQYVQRINGGKEADVPNWQNFFDKNPESYLLGIADESTFPNLSEEGAMRILLHLNVFAGNIPQKPKPPVSDLPQLSSTEKARFNREYIDKENLEKDKKEHFIGINDEKKEKEGKEREVKEKREEKEKEQNFPGSAALPQ